MSFSGSGSGSSGSSGSLDSSGSNSGSNSGSSGSCLGSGRGVVDCLGVLARDPPLEGVDLDLPVEVLGMDSSSGNRVKGTATYLASGSGGEVEPRGRL